MSDPTTVIVILLAGDSFTASLMDTLLKEIYDGVSAWTAANPPVVHCFYHRVMPTGGVQTYSYPLTAGCLRFRREVLDVSSGVYPPTGSRHHTGDLADQVDAFIGGLPTHGGPVRVVVGAHGNPPLGFNALFLLQKLWLLLRLLLSPFDPALKQLTWKNRVEHLLWQLTPANDPPDAIAVRGALRAADLKADRLAAALDQLNHDRLQTLILHTCTGSMVEIISALKDFPHQIACESVLTGQPMAVSQWFGVLGDPASTAEEITEQCFASLENVRHPQGCFSSYRLTGLTTLLSRLDALGAELLALLNLPDNRSAVHAIADARSTSNLTGAHNDLSLFCVVLQTYSLVPDSVLTDVIGAVCDMLVAPAEKISTGTLTTQQEQWAGIGFYLPVYHTGGFDLTELPQEFRDQVPRWLEFLDRWQS